MVARSRRLPEFLLVLGFAALARAELVTETPLVSRVLPNGFEVIVYPDSSVPLVTINFVVRQGSQFETAADNGLAHLNEHMFWRSNRGHEQQADYLKDIGTKGITYNGSTHEEYSESYVTALKEDLPVALRFIRDAALYPTYDPGEVAGEANVVIGELDRLVSNANRRFNLRGIELLFPSNPAAKKPQGRHEVIARATAAQMHTMHDHFCVPENCALIVAGDCDPAMVFKLVGELFGEWRPGTQNLTVPDFGPGLTKSVADFFFVPDTGPVSVQLSWRGPSAATDTGATYAADTLDHILNQPGSRFQRALVDSGLALSVYSSYYTQRNVGPIAFTLNCEPAKARQAVKVLQDELQQLAASDYFTDEELANAKTSLAANDLYDREKPTEYAHSIAFWWATTGTPYLLGQQQAIRGTTRADIVRYVQRYILGRPYAAVALVPEDKAWVTREDLLTP